MPDTFPGSVHRFRVFASGGDGEEHVLQCHGISGLQDIFNATEYKDGMGNSFLLPAERQAVNITLHNCVSRNDNPIFNWFNSTTLNTVDKKDLVITLLDESGETVHVTWNVYSAFPSKLSEPNLDASSNEMAIEEMSLVADRVEVKFQ